MEGGGDDEQEGAAAADPWGDVLDEGARGARDGAAAAGSGAAAAAGRDAILLLIDARAGMHVDNAASPLAGAHHTFFVASLLFAVEMLKAKYGHLNFKER